MISKEKLGKRIKKAREYKGNIIGRDYTQEDLAQDMNKQRSYISNLEQGLNYPSSAILLEIARICEVPFGFFSENSFSIELVLAIQNAYHNNLHNGIRNYDVFVNMICEKLSLEHSPFYRIFNDDDYDLPDEQIRILLEHFKSKFAKEYEKFEEQHFIPQRHKTHYSMYVAEDHTEYIAKRHLYPSDYESPRDEEELALVKAVLAAHRANKQKKI